MTSLFRGMAVSAGLVLAFGCALPAAASEDERLQAFFEAVFQRNLKDSPILQAQLGMKGPDYGRWGDFSDAEAMRQNELVRENLQRLRADFDPAKLSEQSRISYRIFEFLQERALRNFPWRFHNYAFTTMQNPVTQYVTFMQNVHRVDDVADAEAYVSRLAAIETVSRQFIERLDLAAARGIVPTSFAFDPVLGDARNVLTGVPFDASGKDSAILADFRAKVGRLEAADADKERLLAAGTAALNGPFRRGIESSIARIEGLRASSPGPHGVWKLPDGDAFYRNQIDFWTSDATMTADRIHDIGLAEVARIRGEMMTIMRKVGFEGGLPEFFRHLRTDPSNFLPNTDAGRQAYLDRSKAYIDAVYSDVGRYFNVLPKAALEVRRVEEWREDSAPIAFYSQPAPDGSRPGIYYVNLKDMSTRQLHEIETIAYHEGAPGHHFQLAIQYELQDVPMFQKFAYFGAYIEGWGLYAERLAREQGRFTDPLQDFGRLQNEMLRAVRLVVDTGAHARQWTREQMIDYMLANNPMSAEDAAREVERYIDHPGQALSYKVGMIRILELRERARNALGARFDIRDFHDVVLKNGAVALPILEQLVDDYIAATRGA